MFNGEYAGLKKIIETDTVRVPHPMKVNIRLRFSMSLISMHRRIYAS